MIKKDQTDLYIETIDALQVLIDQYASIAPIKIIGDLNTPLPLSEKLSKNWYKQKNFNLYSSVLYDFLVFNDFIAADMLHKQNVNYTYFCHKNETYMWINPILCNRLDVPFISSCEIIPEEPTNCSDHLPIQLKFSIKVSESSPKKETYDRHKGIAKPNWTNDEKKKKYANLVDGKISNISPIDTHELTRDDYKK